MPSRAPTLEAVLALRGYVDTRFYQKPEPVEHWPQFEKILPPPKKKPTPEWLENPMQMIYGIRLAGKGVYPIPANRASGITSFIWLKHRCG